MNNDWGWLKMRLLSWWCMYIGLLTILGLNCNLSPFIAYFCFKIPSIIIQRALVPQKLSRMTKINTQINCCRPDCKHCYMGPTWDDRTQVGPILAPCTLLSGMWLLRFLALVIFVVQLYFRAGKRLLDTVAQCIGSETPGEGTVRYSPGYRTNLFEWVLNGTLQY